MKKAVITILGLIGGNDNHQKAQYYFEDNKTDIKEYYNTFPLLCKKYSKDYTIVPLHTKEAKAVNEKVLAKSAIEFTNFDEKYFIEDDKDFTKLFKIIDNTIDDFDDLIIDVSHGFRHLPILMIVDLIIQNFKDTSKIKKILFAKEIVQFKEYEIIDLKEYLDLANISFILTTFEKNYTVANHIKSIKYPDLMIALNDFSNDIMALSLNHLFTISAPQLIEKLNAIVNDSMKKQAIVLSEHIVELTTYNGKKRYQTYFDLSKELFDKNYMLLSLALLYESIRMYIKTTIKKDHQELIGRVETFFEGDLYEIGFFCKNLDWKQYDKKTKKIDLTENEYKALQLSFNNLKIKELYKKIDKKRNNLAHANSDKESFNNIKTEIGSLLSEYEKKCIQSSKQ